MGSRRAVPMNPNHLHRQIDEPSVPQGFEHRRGRGRRRRRTRTSVAFFVLAQSVLLLQGTPTNTTPSADAFALLPLPSSTTTPSPAAPLSLSAVVRAASAYGQSDDRVEGGPTSRGGTRAKAAFAAADTAADSNGSKADPDRRRRRQQYSSPRRRPKPPESDRPTRNERQGHHHPHHHRTSKERRNDSRRIGHHPLLSLNLNLDALASSSSPSLSSTDDAGGGGGGELAQELYQRISALYEEGYYAVPPDIVSFNSVLKAWRDDPERALQFWEQEMVPRVEDDEREYYYDNNSNKNDDRSGPTSSLTNGQSSWRDLRKERRPAGPRRRTRTPLLEPNVRSYNTFLWALARAGMYKQAEMLLESLRHDQSLVLPDRITYNTVLLAYANALRGEDGGGGGGGGGSSAAPAAASANINNNHGNSDDLGRLPDRALQLLDEMLATTYITPDVVTFNTILSVFAAVGTYEAARKAQELVEKMKSLGIRPDAYTYAAVLQAWASVRDNDSNRNSDDITMSASQRALTIFEEMKAAGIQPNAVTYTIVLQALCRSNQPQAATALLQEVIDQSSLRTGSSGAPEEEVRPDAVMFSALMDGWARWVKESSPRTARPEQRKAAASEAVRSVLDLLSQMNKLSTTWPDVAPNERTYTSVLTTLARSRHFSAGLRAERVLEDMVQQHGIVPSTVHWNAALDAHAKSPRPDKVREARRVWAAMVSSSAEPDLVTYHALLSAAASTRSDVDDSIRRDCVKTGLQAFAMLQRDPNVRPTSLSFHYLFKILGRFLVPPSSDHHRTSVVRAAFRLCCESGCLNDTLLRQLREHVVSPDDERQIVGELLGGVQGWRPNLSVAELPSSWSTQPMNN